MKSLVMARAQPEATSLKSFSSSLLRPMGARKDAGFTLIEVLLSLAIFTMIGITTVRYISQLQNTKTQSFEGVDSYDSTRSALAMIRADLTQAFHVLQGDLGVDNRQALQRNEPVPHTIFDGRKDVLVFTSLSHRVFYSDRRESDQCEISYFLHTPNGAKLPSLMKRESPIIDGDLFQGGKVVRLLDNVGSLKFEFWDTEQGKWVEDWTSEQGSKIDKFPIAVKIKLRVDPGQGRESVDVFTTVKLAFPNNKSSWVQF